MTGVYIDVCLYMVTFLNADQINPSYTTRAMAANQKTQCPLYPGEGKLLTVLLGIIRTAFRLKADHGGYRYLSYLVAPVA